MSSETLWHAGTFCCALHFWLGGRLLESEVTPPGDVSFIFLDSTGCSYTAGFLASHTRLYIALQGSLLNEACWWLLYSFGTVVEHVFGPLSLPYVHM